MLEPAAHRRRRAGSCPAADRLTAQRTGRPSHAQLRTRLPAGRLHQPLPRQRTHLPLHRAPPHRAPRWAPIPGAERGTPYRRKEGCNSLGSGSQSSEGLMGPGGAPGGLPFPVAPRCGLRRSAFKHAQPFPYGERRRGRHQQQDAYAARYMGCPWHRLRQAARCLTSTRNPEAPKEQSQA